MLQFYYDFFDKYLDRSDFQKCEMDTDSAYIAIAGDSVESLMKPELKAEFEADKCNWFPRTEPICLNIRPIISESQVFLWLSGKDKRNRGFVLQDLLPFWRER